MSIIIFLSLSYYLFAVIVIIFIQCLLVYHLGMKKVLNTFFQRLDFIFYRTEENDSKIMRQNMVK